MTRRVPLTAALAGVVLAALLAPRPGAADDALDKLAGPPSSRFT